MIDAYNIYVALFWPVMAFFGALAVTRLDTPLMRCIGVVCAGQLATDIWFAKMETGAWDGQPWQMFLLIYVVSTAVVTIRPSGKTCSAMGGVFMAGVVFSIVRGSFYWTNATDLMYWQSNVILGWLTILVIAGGSAGETGRRILAGLGGGIARLVRPSRVGGLA